MGMDPISVALALVFSAFIGGIAWLGVMHHERKACAAKPVALNLTHDEDVREGSDLPRRAGVRDPVHPVRVLRQQGSPKHAVRPDLRGDGDAGSDIRHPA